MSLTAVAALYNILLVFILVTTCETSTEKTGKLLVIITAQDNAHHLNYAKLTKAFIDGHAPSVKNEMAVEVIISTETWPDVSGLWSFFPLLNEVSDLYANDGVEWLLLIPEITEVNLPSLLKITQQYDPKQPHFIGRALQDQGRSIIHHYADPSLKYPDSTSGILISWALLTHPNKEPPKDFNIDPCHELATYFYDNGRGSAIVNAPEFCSPDAEYTDKCATHYSVNSYLCPASSTHKAVTEDDIFVIVKTGEVFHSSRVPLQKRLWTNGVKNLEICSEREDNSIPTVKLDVKNTKSGHCAKFYAILKRAVKEKHINTKQWLVVVDDDTIMNITRLTKLLSCYSTSVPVVLGERYGYQAHLQYGYDYVTGGGGTVLNMAAVKAIMSSNYKCGKEDDPDDMMVGMWLHALGIPILHSPLFHQRPPSSYSMVYLESQREYAISFHKYDEDKPEQVATEWLGLSLNSEEKIKHTEL